MPSKTPRIVVAAAAALLWGGCTEPPSPRERFIERADAICREAEERAQALGKPRSPRQLDTFMARAERITNDMVEDLRALEPPEGDSEKVESLLTQIEEAIDYFPELGAAYESGKQARVEAVGRKLQSVVAEADEMAGDYGFEVCGKSAPTSTDV